MCQKDVIHVLPENNDKLEIILQLISDGMGNIIAPLVLHNNDVPADLQHQYPSLGFFCIRHDKVNKDVFTYVVQVIRDYANYYDIRGKMVVHFPANFAKYFRW